jgi:hypothetical protein
LSRETFTNKETFIFSAADAPEDEYSDDVTAAAPAADAAGAATGSTNSDGERVGGKASAF